MASVEIRQYQTADDRKPLAEWLDGLRHGATRSRIVA
jgi:hypothetical protein